MGIKAVHKSRLVSSYSSGVSICVMKHVLDARYLSSTLGSTKQEKYV